MKIKITALTEYAEALCKANVKCAILPAICDETGELGEYVRIYPYSPHSADSFYEVVGKIMLKGE